MYIYIFIYVYIKAEMKLSVLTVLWVNLGFSFIALHRLNIQLQQWLCKQPKRGKKKKLSASARPSDSLSTTLIL